MTADADDLVQALSRALARADLDDHPRIRRIAGLIVDGPEPALRICYRCEADMSGGCYWCARPLVGRQRRWCSRSCESKAYRARRAN